jgi:hypothetical protein
VADLHTSQRAGGTQLGKRLWQQIGRKFQRNADAQDARLGGLASDGSHHPVVLGDQSAPFPQQDRPGLGGGDPVLLRRSNWTPS